jgi:periplasmic protein TonB
VNEIKLPLAISVAGHAVCLALLLVFLSEQAPVISEPVAKGGIQVVFEPAPPKLEAVPVAEPTPQPEMPPPPEEPPPPPEPQAQAEPPPPEPPVATVEPPPPEPEAPVAATELPPPPPPPKPVAKKPPKPVHRRQEPPSQPSPAALPALPAEPARPVATPMASPQTASAATQVPAPVPSPDASAGYRALLSSWLDSHKRYPEASRQRGEEGRAVLRFAVDRSGRVLDYAVTSSSGYPDLDQSIEEMMRGATLPPFPAGMPQPRMEISVTIRFSLRR